MDIILEFIMEIVLEGALGLGTGKKVPLPLRILAVLVYFVIYGVVIVLCAIGAIECWKDGDIPIAVFLFVFDISFTTLVVYALRKKYKEKNIKKNGNK